MLALLGAGKVPVGRLELASAEMAAFIPPDKMDILRDIYAVAKEEERLRSTWPAGVNFVPFSVHLSKNVHEVPPKSLGSPPNRNIEPPDTSPITLPEVPTKTKAVADFKNALPFQADIQQTWLPKLLPEYLEQAEASNLTQGGKYTAYVDGVMVESQKSWSMNSEVLGQGMVTSVPAERSERPDSGVLANVELQHSKNLSHYDFPLTFQNSFSNELLPSSLEVEQSQSSSSNLAIQNPPFFSEIPEIEHTNWRNGDFFFANDLSGYCHQTSWKNAIINSAPFEDPHVLPEGSFMR